MDAKIAHTLHRLEQNEPLIQEARQCVDAFVGIRTPQQIEAWRQSLKDLGDVRRMSDADLRMVTSLALIACIEAEQRVARSLLPQQYREAEGAEP